MSDKKFTDLSTQLTPAAGDIFPFISDPLGSPDAKKIPFSGLESSLHLYNQIGKDTDGTLAANSDVRFPTQKAVKTYVDGHITSGTSYTDEMAQDAIGAMIDPTLIYVDATPSLRRAVISGDISIPNGSNLAAIASNVIIDSDINASAAIDATKIGSGDVSSLKFHYLSNVTSDVQTQLANKIVSGSLDIDTALAANSDLRIATQKAVKAYVDNHTFTGSVGNGAATNLAGGTAISFGSNYYDAISSNRVFTFAGSPANGQTCSVKFTVPVASVSVGFPSSLREGDNGIPVTGLVFNSGAHECSWIRDNGTYWLADTASPAKTVFATGASHTVDDLIFALQNLGFFSQT